MWNNLPPEAVYAASLPAFRAAASQAIPHLKARARQLFKAGYKSLNSLAWADVNSLMTDIEHLSRRQANQIVSAAKMLLEEKADALREEAEEMTTVPGKPNT